VCVCLSVCLSVCVSITLSVNSPTGQTPQQIFTVDSLKKRIYVGCAFWGSRWWIITVRGPKSPKTQILGNWIGISSQICEKFRSVYQIDINLTGTSWVVSYGGKTIPRWQTAAILKIDISPYLSVKSSDFHDVIKKWKSCIGQTPSSTERISCSKTTTLLPSTIRTRPLFQGRTGCGWRPSGWYDIVTCQRLVL